MNGRTRVFPHLTMICVALTALTATTAPATADGGWPRTLMLDDAEVVLHQPQIDSWTYFTKLAGRIAVSISPPGAREPIVGALRIQADTQTDLEGRTVVLYNVKIVEARFPSLEAGQASRWQQRLGALLPTQPQSYALDRLLAALEANEAKNGILHYGIVKSCVPRTKSQCLFRSCPSGPGQVCVVHA